ncbi:MAG: hypothetical protein E6H71_00065 [Betaproteobacteria bacterium]|nr:MAG: hypothetical protein E6H71_00065 [Betaproteobacteria bacterium]
MKRSNLVVAAIMLGVVLPVVALADKDATSSNTQHRWKFAPTIYAPWAQEDDENDFDTPLSAAGLCRSSPFNTLNAYGPLGSNVDVIVGDAPNNSGFSSFGCITAQNETTIAVNPTNPNNLIAGSNDYRAAATSMV